MPTNNQPIGWTHASSDGSFLYMSHKGLLCLDDRFDLEEAVLEDRSFLNGAPVVPTISLKDKAYIKKGSSPSFINKYLEGRHPHSSR